MKINSDGNCNLEWHSHEYEVPSPFDFRCMIHPSSPTIDIHTQRYRNGYEAAGKFVLSSTDEAWIWFYGYFLSSLYSWSASLLAFHGGFGRLLFFFFLNLSTLLLWLFFSSDWFRFHWRFVCFWNQTLNQWSQCFTYIVTCIFLVDLVCFRFILSKFVGV